MPLLSRQSVRHRRVAQGKILYTCPGGIDKESCIVADVQVSDKN